MKPSFYSDSVALPYQATGWDNDSKLGFGSRPVRDTSNEEMTQSQAC